MDWALVAMGVLLAVGIVMVVMGRAGSSSGSGPFGERTSRTSSTTVTLTGGSTGETPDIQQITAALRAAMGSAGTTTTHVEVVDGGQKVIDATDVPGLRDAVLKALADHGIDVADPAASAGASTSKPPPSSAAHEVELLDHLAELHRSGALTDAEFQAAKQRILER